MVLLVCSKHWISQCFKRGGPNKIITQSHVLRCRGFQCENGTPLSNPSSSTLKRVSRNNSFTEMVFKDAHRQGCTPRGSSDNSEKGSLDFSRVLCSNSRRRILKSCFAEDLEGGRVLRRALRTGSKMGLRRHLQDRGGKSTRKNPPNIKSSSEQVFLNNVRWVFDLCHMEEGKSSRKLLEKARVNEVFFLVFQDFGVGFPVSNLEGRNMLFRRVPLRVSCEDVKQPPITTAESLSTDLCLDRSRAPLHGGQRNGGHATFVWQQRAQTRATQMSRMPSLKPVCLLCQKQGLRTLFPLTAFKNAPNPKFVQNLSRRLFFGVPIRGTQICQKFVENLRNDNFRTNFQIFDKFLTNLGPPDWNPEKQLSGQILDKFGVRGVFECCKGKKGSQSKAHCVIDASFACHREKTYPPFRPPHSKVPEEVSNGISYAREPHVATCTKTAFPRTCITLILRILTTIGNKIITYGLFRFGELYSVIVTGTLQHNILGGINYCNVMIAAVLPWKPRIFQLQLQL